MSSRKSDDAVIAVAFKRSLLFVLLIAGIVIAILAYNKASITDNDVNETASPIATQVLDRAADPEPPMVLFKDVTKASGIHHSHANGAYGERLLPETMGGGVAVLDFNNDGNSDLLFVNGSNWPWAKSKESQISSLLLYQGRGDGTFADVTEQTGLNIQFYGMGVAVGDYDNDGDQDLFLTVVGKNRLFRNESGQTFVDVTDTAAVAGHPGAWSTGAAFVDIDNDQDLDLFVVNYVKWSRQIDLQADYQLTGIGRAYGPPTQFAGTDSFLYRNNGDGTFEDVSESFGTSVLNANTGFPEGKGLAVLPIDVDDDGWMDLIVANDMVRNFLFRNKAGQGFEEIGVESGIAFDNIGSATGAMGIDGLTFGDTGEQAVAIGNFGNEMTSLYVRPQKSTVFTDQAIITGVGPVSRRVVTFGLFFFDYDLDGQQDLLQANGHIENQINVVEPGQSYEQKTQLFWNCGHKCKRQFTPVKLSDSNALAQPIVGRGAAYTDFDNDGDLDVVLTQIGTPPLVLRNEQQTGNNWIQLDLRNTNGSPDLGAKVSLTTELGTVSRNVNITKSYLSQVSPVLSIGLGSAKQVIEVQLTWSDGRKQTLTGLEINQRHTIISSKNSD